MAPSIEWVSVYTSPVPIIPHLTIHRASPVYSLVHQYIGRGTTPSPEILPPSDVPSPVNGILWEMSELIIQERIAVGSSNFVEGLTT